jgi:hypothetical protein
VPLEDYLFRFDRGAFWMARHGLAIFYGGAAWAQPAPGSGASAGPAWPLRVLYAWLATTRQLYRMLHAVGDETLARVYVVQDFILPSAAAAADFVERVTSGARVAVWPLWLCPVRMVAPRHAADAGFGFPVQAPAAAGDLWFNVGVYGQPGGGAPFDPVVINRHLERGCAARGGRKMLYAQTFDTPATFWAQFDRAAYARARAAYAGGDAVFPDVAKKVLLGDARLAASFAEEMLRRDIYVIAFSYPVVPKGAARIRTQMSAAHSQEDIDTAVDAFVAVGKQLGVIQ